MEKKWFKLSVLMVLIFGQAIEYGAENNPPAVGLTYVPKYGSSENLQGRALNANPKNFAVAVYIEVDGGWWIKPYWDSPVTKINSDGTWVCDITTGGIDETATRIIAYLIPINYEPPLTSGDLQLSLALEDNAVAKAEARRNASGKSGKIDVQRNILKGLCYGPFRDNENPDMGVFPLIGELKDDLEFISNSKIAATIKIRMYGSADTPAEIPAMCEKFGVECYLGAWLSKYNIENKKEIESVIRIANQGLRNVKALIVGNEVLLRKDMTEEELIAYIREVKKSTALPVTTAEIWAVWKEHPQLAKEVDFLTAHIHPYWEGIPVDRAAEYVVNKWKDMKSLFPDKRIVIGETGWPSEGKTVSSAIPSKENQARFFKEFIQLAEREDIEYFYFELFDEKWKDKFEDKAGAHWGIFNSDGSPKDLLKDFIPVQAKKGIVRPPRKVLPVTVSAPLIVYLDAGLAENRFQPSGWMGDLGTIELDRECKINPHSGKTCVRIAYKPAGFLSQGWSGIYWQYPLNNWGEYPGYRLLGAGKLTFWARGEKGGEEAEFKTGGISNWFQSGPYHDSFGPISTGIIKLTNEWEQYTIDLKNQDTSSVIGGFCWATNSWQNPKGCTIYLDDIQFEP